MGKISAHEHLKQTKKTGLVENQTFLAVFVKLHERTRRIILLVNIQKVFTNFLPIGIEQLEVRIE